MAEPAISALIVRVDAATPLVGALRQRYDASAAQGLPPHITILVPFIPPDQVTTPARNRLTQVLAGIAAFPFRLAHLGRWPDVSYLAPVPAEPFVHLTRAVWSAFPAFPPYGGQYPTLVPHLTVASGSTAEVIEAERELMLRLAAAGPVDDYCDGLDWIENRSGRWQLMQRLPLAGGPR